MLTFPTKTMPSATAGRPFRILTVVDQWSRQGPLLEVASSMSGVTVGHALDRVLEGRSAGGNRIHRQTASQSTFTCSESGEAYARVIVRET